MISFYVRYINTETVFSVKKKNHFKRHSRIYFPKDILFVTISTMLVSVVWDFLNQKESQNKKYLLEMNTKKYIHVHVYTSNCMARFNAIFFGLNIFFFTIIALKSLLCYNFIFLSPYSFADWLSNLPFINVYSFCLAEQNI